MSGEQAQRLAILVVAYACEPGRGSEPGAGWGLVEALGTFADCTVLVAPEHSARLEDHVRATGETRHRFVEVGVPRWARYARWHRIPEFLTYLAWLRRARREALHLRGRQQFHVAHHATFAVYWLPSPVVDLELPTVWGPVGGAVVTPLQLWPLLGIRGVMGEVLDLVAVRLASWLRRTRRTWRRAGVRILQNSQTAKQLDGVEGPTLILNHAMFTRIEARASVAPADHMLWVGGLEARKGPRLAVRALAHTDPDIRLVMVGDGPERKAIERLADRLDVADRLELRGKVERAEVIQLLGSATAAVFTGLREEGGLALAEAMLMGTPVVVLGNGGARTLAEAATDASRVAIVEPASPGVTARRLAKAMMRMDATDRSPRVPLLDQAAAIAQLRDVFVEAAGRSGASHP